MAVKVWAYLNDELMEIEGDENPQTIEGQGEFVFEVPAETSFEEDMEVRYVFEEVDDAGDEPEIAADESEASEDAGDGT